MATATPASASTPSSSSTSPSPQEQAAAPASAPVATQAPVPVTTHARTFYRRPLPATLVAFSSLEGRRLFREALADGGMEAFFPLSEHFTTQADPAYCGLGTLTMALNALAIDPGRTWKGPWRWYDETLLDCCEPLEVVRAQGIPLRKLHCLAKCNGARSRLRYGDAVSLEAFRENVVRTTHSAAGREFVVVAYCRTTLGQTGSGHFSPVGGYHRGRDLALVMDVARFKYPPHWVPLPLLWEAMRPIDPATGRSRGYLVLSRSAFPAEGEAAAAATATGGGGGSLLFTLDQDRYAEWPRLKAWLLALHLQEARGGIASSSSGAAGGLFAGNAGEEQEDEAGRFRRFLALVPPDLASVVATLPYVAELRAGSGSGSGSGDCKGNGGGSSGDDGSGGDSPHAYVRALVRAIEAHPLFRLLTPEALAPFRQQRPRRPRSLSEDSLDGSGQQQQLGGSGAACCPKLVHEGHALLALYLALRAWAAAAAAGADGQDDEEKGQATAALDPRLGREVEQLRVKLQTLAAELPLDFESTAAAAAGGTARASSGSSSAPDGGQGL